ncbi:unnamed protein product [Urochloa humidicola]
MAWLVSCDPDGTRKDFTTPALSFRPSLNLDPGPSQKRLTRLCEEAPFSSLPSSPALAGAMSQRAESSALRNQMSELVGTETGLPMMICPSCKRARVFEARSQKENKNHGRVYVKCPRYVSWVANKCDYYRWQKKYFEDLVAAKVIRVFLSEEDEIQEVQSINQIPAAGSPAPSSVVLQNNKLKAKVEKLSQAMLFVGLVVVVFVSMAVGYALK